MAKIFGCSQTAGSLIVGASWKESTEKTSKAQDKTLKLKYALDITNNGRNAFSKWWVYFFGLE